jgi:hypothetical protein
MLRLEKILDAFAGVEELDRKRDKARDESRKKGKT